MVFFHDNFCVEIRLLHEIRMVTLGRTPGLRHSRHEKASLRFRARQSVMRVRRKRGMNHGRACCWMTRAGGGPARVVECDGSGDP